MKTVVSEVTWRDLQGCDSFAQFNTRYNLLCMHGTTASVNFSSHSTFLLILTRGYITDFREREGGSEREREKHWCGRKILISTCHLMFLQEGMKVAGLQVQGRYSCNISVTFASKSCLLKNLFFILTQGHSFFIAFRERKREKHRFKREALICCLSYVPRPGNQTHNLPVTRQHSNQLSCTGQGKAVLSASQKVPVVHSLRSLLKVKKYFIIGLTAH